MPHDNILQNAIPHLASLWDILRTGFVVFGFGLTIWSLCRMAFASRDRGQGRAFKALVVGVLFLNVPAFLDALSQTFLGQNATQALSYLPPATEGQVYVQFAVFLTALVGLVALGRGLWILKNSNNYQGFMGRGMIHICGGVFCVNLVETIRLIAKALGGNLPETVQAIFG
jgi:hypothetical protein